MLPLVGFAVETKYTTGPGTGTFNSLNDAEAALRAFSGKFAPLAHSGTTSLSDTMVRFSYEARPRLVGVSPTDWVYNSSFGPFPGTLSSEAAAVAEFMENAGFNASHNCGYDAPQPDGDWIQAVSGWRYNPLPVDELASGGLRSYKIKYRSGWSNKYPARNCQSESETTFYIRKHRRLDCPNARGYVLKHKEGGCINDATGYIDARSVSQYFLEPSPVNPRCEGEGNPCNPATGNKSQREIDLSSIGLGGLEFTRFYSSQGDYRSAENLAPGWRHTYARQLNESTLSVSLFRYNPERSSLHASPRKACLNGWREIKGRVWNGAFAEATAVVADRRNCRIQLAGKTVANFAIRIQLSSDRYLSAPEPVSAQLITLSRPNGHAYRFEEKEGVWVTPLSSGVSLVKNGTEWLFTDTDNTQEYYDSTGKLLSITDERGNTQTLSYDTNDRLSSVGTNTGEYIQFDYDTSNRISTVTDHTDRTWGYRYDVNGNLEFVDNPDGTVKTYHYEDTHYPNHLTGITDERSKRYATWAYNTEGKAILSMHAGGVERVDLTYNPDGTTTVQGSLGTTRTYHFAPERGSLAVTKITGDLCTTCPNGDKKERTYTTEGYLASYTDWSNTITQLGNHDTKGQYGFKIEAVGTPEQRRTDYTYDSRYYNKVTTKIETSVATGSSKTTTYTYDDFGNRTSVTVDGFRPDGTAVSRMTTYQYNGPLRQLTQIDGPRTDVTDTTTLDYYANDASQGFSRGRLRRITSPAGIVLRDNIQYTATGKVLSEDRPNGISLAYTYYAGNDRLETLTETSGGVSRTTRWTYLATGEVETITQADGTTLATTTRLVYDDARRLTGMIDQLGNHIGYVLDTEGNRIDEKLFDSAGVLYKSVQQTFDIYNRLDTRTLVDEIIDYNFQPDGSLDNRVNAKNITTDFQYDALKRLTTTTGDLGGVDVDTQDTLTQYIYDAGDRLTTVISPNNSNTTYSYDDLGNLLSETSPDRGLRSYSYDEAGNIKSITDARSITVNYSYDALNRVTNIDYPGTDEDIAMTYDSATGCANGVGKLCMVTDSTGTTIYSYTDFGNLAQQTSTISGIAYTTTYDYGSLNRITRITTPSGRIVTYGYDALGRTASIDATVNGADQTIAHDIQYRPDGLLSNITFANGFLEERFYNLKARMTSQTMPLSVSDGPPPPDTRTTVGLQTLYRFQEGSGTIVNDVSGVGTPLNLDISGDTTWTATGLTLNSSSLITSAGAASKVIDAVTTSNAITVEAWITPANTTQTGPARIVSLSLDLYNRNFTLGQQGNRYDMRLRTTGTSNNGIPSVGTAVGTLTPAQTHIVYTRDANGVVNFYKDGILLSTSSTSGDMSNWDNSYRLALANELSADRGWLGSLHLVALYNRALSGTDVVQNFAAGPQPGTAVATNSTSPGIPAQHSKLLILASTATTTKPYTVWRKGKETNHQWMQTAEDPNAYDRPPALAYLTPDNLNIWPQQGKGFNTLPLDHVIFDIHGANTGMKKGEYLNVSHGGTPPASSSIDSETWIYTYDANGNVDTIDTTTGTTIYGYDALDRLTGDDQPTQAADTLNYDRNGNRTNITDGVISMASSYLPNSNQLDTLGGGIIGHDLAGNRTSDPFGLSGGNRTLEYNNAGRLFRVYEGGMLIATYTYNYQGQRTRKVTQNSTTVYHYDQNGSLISETDELGAPIRDIVYRNTVSVAQIDTGLSTETITYLHSDHLGTPRRGTDENGVVVWSWSSDAFGAAAANDDPDGDGVNTVVNLRFPGQYYDAETRLHYNYFRYYDPSTGRYTTSDPIGLKGGVNTYAYVENNPTNLIDPLGLLGSPGYCIGFGCYSVYGGPFGPICGSGPNTSYIPDGIYREACENHDRCYGTCGKSKFDCDAEFARDGAPIYALVLLFAPEAEEAYNNAQDEAGCNDGNCND